MYFVVDKLVTKSLYVKLWKNIDRKRKVQSIFLIVLTFLSAIAELFTLSAVIPFVTVIMSPDKIYSVPFVGNIFSYFNINMIPDIKIFITTIFIFLIFLAGFFKVILVNLQTRLSFEIGADFSNKMYLRTLRQPLLVHINRNSNKTIGTILIKSNILSSSILLPFFTIFSSLITLVFILAALIIVNPKITLIILIIFLTIYFLIHFATKKKLGSESLIVNSELDNLTKSLADCLSSIRDIIIGSHHNHYIKNFEKFHYSYRISAGNIHIISSVPKFFVEVIGIIGLIFIALFLLDNSEQSANTLPTIAIFVLGAQKIFPLLQNIYSSQAIFRGNKYILLSIFDLMDQQLFMQKYKKKDKIKFKKKIAIKNINFGYKLNTQILKGLDIEFSKGDKVGIIGETGSGKSTFIDLLMGLIFPQEGGLYIDEKKIDKYNCVSWYKNIAFVPQNIHLIDASIAENIAFGFSKNQINMKDVKNAAKKAQISETISSFELGYETEVGEKGMKLSGGQRQRIGLARAFYKQKDLLILDEATNALDYATEKKVIDAVINSQNNLTAFIVTHRISILKECSKIIKIKNSKISFVGSYEDIHSQYPNEK